MNEPTGSDKDIFIQNNYPVWQKCHVLVPSQSAPRLTNGLKSTCKISKLYHINLH